MLKLHRSATVVFALGFLMFPGLESTSLAAGVGQDAASGQNLAAANVGPADMEGGSDLALTLAWFDRVGLGDDVTTRMRSQVEKIFAEMGIAIAWYAPASVSNPDDTDPGYYLKVMLHAYEPGTLGHDPATMGVVIGTQTPPDAVWMFDPAIRRALADGRRKARPLSSVEKARAYATVLSHEVLHALANDQRHVESGLMAPAQNRKVLISGAINVDAESAAACRLGLERIGELAE